MLRTVLRAASDEDVIPVKGVNIFTWKQPKNRLIVFKHFRGRLFPPPKYSKRSNDVVVEPDVLKFLSPFYKEKGTKIRPLIFTKNKKRKFFPEIFKPSWIKT